MMINPLKGTVHFFLFCCSNALSWPRNSVRCVSSTSFEAKSAPKTKFWGKKGRHPTKGTKNKPSFSGTDPLN